MGRKRKRDQDNGSGLSCNERRWRPQLLVELALVANGARPCAFIECEDGGRFQTRDPRLRTVCRDPAGEHGVLVYRDEAVGAHLRQLVKQPSPWSSEEAGTLLGYAQPYSCERYPNRAFPTHFLRWCSVPRSINHRDDDVVFAEAIWDWDSFRHQPHSWTTFQSRARAIRNATPGFPRTVRPFVVVHYLDALDLTSLFRDDLSKRHRLYVLSLISQYAEDETELELS